MTRSLKSYAENRSTAGTKINTLNFGIQNESTSVVDESQAHPGIKDADFAKVSSELVKSEIIIQSNMSMLQNNIKNQQNKIQLLQG
ncbi:flagellin [Bacillus sp. OK048]|uniref:flagellin n=1 Tax=Bacillus sp. OK048 TaxID=1882761 RepID=UPI000888878F|nr:flagellin [Bacillus sp. OK048]SDM42156.1 flagellin C-terminal helical region [Bacillus sp. OK048]